MRRQISTQRRPIHTVSDRDLVPGSAGWHHRGASIRVNQWQDHIGQNVFTGLAGESGKELCARGVHARTRVRLSCDDVKTVRPGIVAKTVKWKRAQMIAAFIGPMVPILMEKLPEDPDWLVELKLDGYRALAIKTGGKIHLRSRNTTISTPATPAS